MFSPPRKVVVPCVFRVVPAVRDKELCENPAEYSAEFVLPDGRSFFLEFCSAHLPKASALAEEWVEEIFGESGLRIACAQFNELMPGYISQSEGFLATQQQPAQQFAPQPNGRATAARKPLTVVEKKALFRRLANQRVNKTLDLLKLIGQLGKYEPSDEQKERIVKAIEARWETAKRNLSQKVT